MEQNGGGLLSRKMTYLCQSECLEALSAQPLSR